MQKYCTHSYVSRISANFTYPISRVLNGQQSIPHPREFVAARQKAEAFKPQRTSRSEALAACNISDIWHIHRNQ